MENGNYPKVSVFMFCYNHEAYVQTAIESVLNQTYKNLELIVANNGSTDRSGEIIAKYKDRIKIITLEKNNIPECAKRLFTAADGEYLAQISSDDYWYPDKLEKQIKAMQERPECKVCFTWSEMTDSTLTKVVDNKHFRQENRNRYEWCRYMISNETVLEVSSCVMVNGEKAWKYYEDSFRFYQYSDLKELLNMVLDTEIYIVQEYLVKHRMHRGAVGDDMTEGVRARSCMELNYIIKELWETMPDDFFINTFYGELLDQNAETKAEIACERIRMYFKLAEGNPAVFGEGALEYCWRHYHESGVAELLKQKYGLPMEKIYEYSGKYGDFRIKQAERITLLENKLIQNGLAGQILTDEQRTFFEKLIQCNQLIFSIAFDGSKQQELCSVISLSLESIRASLDILFRIGIVTSGEELTNVMSAFAEVEKSGNINGRLSMIVTFLKTFNERLQQILL